MIRVPKQKRAQSQKVPSLVCAESRNRRPGWQRKRQRVPKRKKEPFQTVPKMPTSHGPRRQRRRDQLQRAQRSSTTPASPRSGRTLPADQYNGSGNGIVCLRSPRPCARSIQLFLNGVAACPVQIHAAPPLVGVNSGGHGNTVCLYKSSNWSALARQGWDLCNSRSSPSSLSINSVLVRVERSSLMLP
jgi:hypothetical protein